MTEDGPALPSTSLEGFEDLYRRHHQRVVAYIRQRVGDPELAQDLAADAFLQALLHFHCLRQREAGLGWLLTISRRTVSAHLRRRSPVLLRDEPPPWAGQDACDPLRSLEEEELAWALRQAVLSLPPRQRQALLLRFVHGLRGPQMARRMGIEAGTARLLLHRAVRRLRQALGRYAEAG